MSSLIKNEVEAIQRGICRVLIATYRQAADDLEEDSSDMAAVLTRVAAQTRAQTAVFEEFARELEARVKQL